MQWQMARADNWGYNIHFYSNFVFHVFCLTKAKKNTSEYFGDDSEHLLSF